MPHALRVLAAPLLAVLVLGRAPAAAQDREVGRLQPAIDAAIDGGVAHLLRTQLRDGSWEHVTDQYRNGSTALCALALLKSGVPREHAALQRALGFLQRELPQRTYSAGVELLLLAALDDPAYAERARAIAELLVDWEHDGERGAWAYPHGRADLSNTQLAALGLWSAWKLGVKPDRNLWKRTLEATIERHQEAPREVEWLTRGRSGKQRVAGFHYLGLEEPPPASASMTTAGLCVLKLGELVLGKDVGGRLQRDVDEHARQALAWLEHDWAVDRNAGREDPRQYLHYYLYGLERVAALYELDRIGEHAWYREGAEFLVADQKGGGEWGDQAQTSFALLFLSRATHPSSGPRARAAENARATEQGSVRLRGVLDEDLVLTLAGLDPALVEDYVAGGGAGVRVARVEYLVDGAVVATVAGDPARVWSGERYPARWSPARPAEYELRVRVALVPPDADPAGAYTAEVYESEPLRWALEPSSAAWLARMASFDRADVLVGAKVASLTASTQRWDASGPDKLRDGRESTRWVAAPDDPAPWVRLALERPVRAAGVRLAPAVAGRSQRGAFDRFVRLAVVVNRDAPIEVVVPDDADELDPLLVPLPGRPRVRLLEVRVLESRPAAPGRREGVGLAELSLYDA
ncbi:MAG: hypothetical protein H6828_08005 [Planctomycetes bacterium]|nr:hypothetical protein [Planctomycetota bacterium]